MEKIKFGNETLKFEKPRLKRWTELEHLRSTVQEATDRGSKAKAILNYLSVVYGKKTESFSENVWYEVFQLYLTTIRLCGPDIDFPILHAEGSEDFLKYDNHVWYSISTTIIKHTGWSLDFVAEMDLNDAIGILQEIKIQEHLDREFLWTLSENSKSYDKATNKYVFNPYPKPSWMTDGLAGKLKLKKTRMLKSMLPVGIIKKSGMEEYVNEQAAKSS